MNTQVATAKVTPETLALAVEKLATNLKHSCDDADRKDCVKWLARDIDNADVANQIAELFGLKSSYYKA